MPKTTDDADRKCVNHTRRPAAWELINVPLCDECARAALRAVLAFEKPARRPRQQTLAGTT